VYEIVALTHDASRILFLGSRHVHHPANAFVAREIGVLTENLIRAGMSSEIG
jgi:hypothetical protein